MSAHVLDAHERELAHDHVTICLGENGHAEFYPSTVDPARLAFRLRRLLRNLEGRDWIDCAPGNCRGHDREDGK